MVRRCSAYARSVRSNFMRRQLTILILTISSLTLTGQKLDGGNGHALILDKQGHVWTIGRNNYGQLGDSTLENSPTPKKIKNLNDIVVISRGYDHSIALDKNGNLFLWGRNNYGQLGCSSVNDQLTPQKLPNHTGFVAVEGGHWHTVGLKKDGTVWCWGHNYFAELGNGTREHSSWPVEVLQISNSEISVLNNIVSIASVGYHTLALKKDGTVWGWGGNTFNELGTEGLEFQRYAIKVVGIPRIKEIAVGWHHSVALDYKGKVWVWGSDPAFQFNEETKKYYHHPTLLKGLPKVTKIACGSWHSLAIDENKNVWGWGKNHFGMLGTGDTISHSTPILLKSLKNIVDIGGGCFQSIAVDSIGRIFSFGDNPSGQQGIGNFSRCYSPKLMPLDINGILSNDTSSVSTNSTSIQPMTNLYADQPKFNLDIFFKVINYMLFLISVILNIVLYRKLKSYR